MYIMIFIYNVYTHIYIQYIFMKLLREKRRGSQINANKQRFALLYGCFCPFPLIFHASRNTQQWTKDFGGFNPAIGRILQQWKFLGRRYHVVSQIMILPSLNIIITNGRNWVMVWNLLPYLPRLIPIYSTVLSSRILHQHIYPNTIWGWVKTLVPSEPQNSW